MSFPNSITLSRIIGALCLLPLEVTTQVVSPFWLVYAFSGMTDMADGYVAAFAAVQEGHHIRTKG